MSPVHLLWTLLTLTILGLSPADQSEPDALARTEQALKLVQKGDLQGAEVELRCAVEVAPTDAFCLASLGSILGMEQKLEESNLYLLGGQVASLAADFETAGRLFASIEKTYPDPAKLRYNQAILLYRMNRIDECQLRVQLLILESRGSSDLYNLQAWCLYKQGRFKEAVAAMDQAIDLEPGRAIQYLDLGKILVESHRDAVALVAAQKAVEVAPASSEAYLLKGLAEYNLKLFAAFVESYHRAVELSPDTSEPLLGLALALAISGAKEEAIAAFEQGIKRFPQEAKFYQECGRFLLDPVNAGDPGTEAKAMLLLKKAIALNASLPEPQVQLGDLALAQGRAEEAASHLEIAAKLDPGNSRVFYSLSRAYRHLGRTEEALKSLRTYEKLKVQEETSTRTATE